MIKRAALAMVVAMGAMPHVGHAQMFDTFRINVPYQITLGTDKYVEANISCWSVANTWALGYDTPTDNTYVPAATIDLRPNGAASGQITFEFRDSGKSAADEGGNVLTFEQVTENLVVAEIWAETRTRISEAGEVLIQCFIRDFLDRDGVWHRWNNPPKNSYKSRADLSLTMTLSSDSTTAFREGFSLSNNEYRSILPDGQATVSTQVSPNAQQTLSPAANSSLQDLLNSVNGGAN